METETRIICITCPKGCTLEVTHDGQTVLRVNQGCKRGREYAQRELSDPRRMVATTVRVHGGIHPLLPVTTAAPFPKPRIRELMDALRRVEVQAPVEAGQPVLADALGTGIDVVASRRMEPVSGV
jgi:CxxC motif-containing protein